MQMQKACRPTIVVRNEPRDEKNIYTRTLLLLLYEVVAGNLVRDNAREVI